MKPTDDLVRQEDLTKSAIQARRASEHIELMLAVPDALDETQIDIVLALSKKVRRHATLLTRGFAILRDRKLQSEEDTSDE